MSLSHPTGWHAWARPRLDAAAAISTVLLLACALGRVLCLPYLLLLLLSVLLLMVLNMLMLLPQLLVPKLTKLLMLILLLLLLLPCLLMTPCLLLLLLMLLELLTMTCRHAWSVYQGGIVSHLVSFSLSFLH